MAVLALVLSVAVFAGLTESTSYVQSPFPLNSFVTCNEPFRLSTGEYVPVQRQYPLVPYQPGTPGTVWLPLESGWDAPPGKVSESDLLTHLGNDFNNLLTSSSLSNTDNLNDIPGYAPNPDVVPGRFDNASESIILDYFRANGYGDQACSLIGEWTDLSRNYYPRYFYGTYCALANCSFARGSGCHPSLTYDSLFWVTVLRWDCCQSFVGDGVFGGYEYQCGWLKVRIPIIRNCFCGCGPALNTGGEMVPPIMYG